MVSHVDASTIVGGHEVDEGRDETLDLHARVGVCDTCYWTGCKAAEVGRQPELESGESGSEVE